MKYFSVLLVRRKGLTGFKNKIKYRKIQTKISLLHFGDKAFNQKEYSFHYEVIFALHVQYVFE